ncbi:MAG TPA: hypothetical protein VF950_15400 [Planctomycetota bacterium]
MSRTLRSRTGIGAGAMIALCLATLSAAAQERPVTTGANRADTVKLRVSGRINMDYVQRDAALMAIPNMDTTGGADNNGVNTVEGEVTIRFDAELTEKISAVVEIGRLRVDEGSGGVIPFLGQFNDVDNDITLREAHIKVTDFLSPGVSMKMGILDWSFDTRGRGSALAFDPHRSQLLTRNMINAQDSTGAMAGRYGSDEAAELEPVGFHLTYASGQVTVELVVMPVVSEQGVVSEDEALYAVDFWYNLEQQVGKGSRVGAILAIHNVSDDGGVAVTGSGDQLITFGAGLNLAFQGGIEVFGEFYLQSGTVGRDATAAANEVDAAGRAFMLGGRWTGAGEGKMWVELSFTMLSGDDDAADEEVNSFLSYESINDFLIIEDMYFGLDVDTNYTAFKIMGGMSFSMAGGKDNVDLQIGVGFFTTSEDVVKTNDAGEEDDALGTEIDVKLKYHLSKQASLGLNFGILTGSDLLEDMGGGSNDDAADDSAWLLSLGFDVRY